jgi:hypothetical protein
MPATQEWEEIYTYVLRRLAAEKPVCLQVLQTRPSLEITVDRPVVSTNDTKIGSVALLIKDGFFDTARSGLEVLEELKRRGRSTAKPNVYEWCNKLTTMGFLYRNADKAYIATADAVDRIA